MKTAQALLLIVIAMTLVSCASLRPSLIFSAEKVEPASSGLASTQPGKPASPDEAAMVENAMIAYSNTSPKSVEVIIDGFLPDGCTQLTEVMQSREGKIFRIRLMTIRSEDAICSTALEPFKVPVPLDISELEAGETYQVVVYDHVLDLEIGQADQPEERRG